MTLDEEEQEDLGVVVQSCLESIYEGNSSRSSIRSDPDIDRSDSMISDVNREGRIKLDAEIENLTDSLADNLAASQITVDERKHRDLQRQALIAERESQQLRENCTELERNVALLRTENEQLKAQNADLADGSNSADQRIEEELNKQRIQTDKEIAAYQSQHAYELGDKDKKISELQTEMALMERQHEERLYRLQGELDDFKEQVG